MEWINSSIVTSDLFLDLELVMQHKTEPSLQTVLNLNEIVELVVLKENLLMLSVDLLILINFLNWEEITQLGKDKEINWEYELNNLGKAAFKKPMLVSCLDDEGVLVHGIERIQDAEYEKLGNILFNRLNKGDWRPKTPSLKEDLSIRGTNERKALELNYVKGFNKAFESFISLNPLYWKMMILAAPHIVSYPKKKFETDLTWAYQFYKEVEIYTNFAKVKNLGFNDTILMQPFVALNSQPSENFIEIFYKKLKDVRDKEIQGLLKLQQSWTYCLPPLTSILLQRCKTLDDLPTELIKLRDEFKSLRGSLTRYQREFNEAQTIKEKLELKGDFQNSANVFARKAKRRRKRIIKTLMDFAIEQSDGLIRKDFSGHVSVIIGKLADYIYYKRLYPWVNSFLDLYGKSLEIRLDASTYEKIFGKVNLDHLAEFELFARNSYKMLSYIHGTRNRNNSG